VAAALGRERQEQRGTRPTSQGLFLVGRLLLGRSLGQQNLRL